MAFVLYPHAITGVFASRGAKTIRRTMSVLPVITHVVEIRRTDDRLFTPTEVEPLLETLRLGRVLAEASIPDDLDGEQVPALFRAALRRPREVVRNGTSIVRHVRAQHDCPPDSS